MTYEADTCEVVVDKKWLAVTIDKALQLHPERVKRCPECHGQVCAHRTGVDGMRAHFEHFDAHTGCSKSRSATFTGTTTRHPRALS